MKQEPTADSVVKAHLFGYCSAAPGNLEKHKCPGLYQHYYSGKVKQGRKMVDGLVFLDEYSKCSCLCHVPVDERPVPKKTRKKAAKKVATKRKK